MAVTRQFPHGYSPRPCGLWTARTPDTTIEIARSTDGGRTFSRPQAMEQPAAPGDRGWPALAADGAGNVHTIWLDHRGLASPGGGAHHHHHGGSSTTGEKRDGVAMAQKSALYYASRSVKSSLSDSPASHERELAKGVCYCCKTALATAPGGIVFAAWRHVFVGNIRDIALTMSRDGGRTFRVPARVSKDRWQLDGCPDDGPAITVDATGTAHLVWPTLVSKPEPHKAIFYASTRDGRRFTSRLRVSPEGQNAAHPQIALDTSGRPIVVWDELLDGRRRVVAARRAGRTGAFLQPAMLSTAAAASYPATAASAGGVVVAWVEGTAADSVIKVQRVRVSPE